MRFLSNLFSKNKSDSRGRDFLLKDIPKGSVGCELGVWQGDFSVSLLEVAKPEKLYLVDPWLYQPEFSSSWYGGTVASSQEDMDKIYRSVCARFAHETSVEIIRKKTGDLSGEIPDYSLDWVYIDGNHTYENVLQDLRTFDRKVKPGGTIYGDDYSSGKKGPAPVADAVNAFLEEVDHRLAWVQKRQFCIKKPQSGK